MAEASVARTRLVVPEGLSAIDARARRFAEARDNLAAEVRALTGAIEEAKRRHMPRLRRAAEAAANERSALEALVAEHPELFRRPRTQILHGIRVGFMKAPGRLAWEDAAQVVKLIKKHLPDQVDLLIKVVETPVRKALAQLSAAELKRLGVTIEETGDRVVAQPTDSEIDKLVDALLDEGRGAPEEGA